jgi:hypothetical protein
MLADPRKFFGGAALMAGFIAVLVLIFLPVFDGQNFLNYMDSLFNSISKASAYYVPQLQTETGSRMGTTVEVTIDLHDEAQAAETAALFQRAGANAQSMGASLRVQGDLGRILATCLEDADLMFANDGGAIRERYGYDAKRAMYNWWTALKEMDRDLNRQSRFELAAFVLEVKKKAVECAYNYYGIEPQRIRDRIGIVVFALFFYVLYTCWYGYAIIFLFEGWGLSLSH